MSVWCLCWCMHMCVPSGQVIWCPAPSLGSASHRTWSYCLWSSKKLVTRHPGNHTQLFRVGSLDPMFAEHLSCLQTTSPALSSFSVKVLTKAFSFVLCFSSHLNSKLTIFLLTYLVRG